MAEVVTNIDLAVRLFFTVLIVPMWLHNVLTGIQAWSAAGSKKLTFNPAAMRAGWRMIMLQIERLPAAASDVEELEEYCRTALPYLSVISSFGAAVGHLLWGLDGDWVDENHFYIFLGVQLLLWVVVHFLHVIVAARARVKSP